jgi:chromosome segregation ATPase
MTGLNTTQQGYHVSHLSFEPILSESSMSMSTSNSQTHLATRESGRLMDDLLEDNSKLKAILEDTQKERDDMQDVVDKILVDLLEAQEKSANKSERATQLQSQLSDTQQREVDLKAQLKHGQNEWQNKEKTYTAKICYLDSELAQLKASRSQSVHLNDEREAATQWIAKNDEVQELSSKLEQALASIDVLTREVSSKDSAIAQMSTYIAHEKQRSSSLQEQLGTVGKEHGQLKLQSKQLTALHAKEIVQLQAQAGPSVEIRRQIERQETELQRLVPAYEFFKSNSERLSREATDTLERIRRMEDALIAKDREIVQLGGHQRQPY